MKHKVRSLFISDIHLGTAGAQAEKLLTVLKSHKCDYLYLVGDIIDYWAMKRVPFFPNDHMEVVRRILKMAEQDTTVYWVLGNHDELLREHVPVDMGNLHIVNEVIHETAREKLFLVLHGDQFDVVTRYHRWVAVLGDVAYGVLLRLNRVVAWSRAKLGLPYWSISKATKLAVKEAVQFISDYEANVSHHVLNRGLDGVICGHIHHAELNYKRGILYANTGDWVESCTYIIEDYDGELTLHTLEHS